MSESSITTRTERAAEPFYHSTRGGSLRFAGTEFIAKSAGSARGRPRRERKVLRRLQKVREKDLVETNGAEARTRATEREDKSLDLVLGNVGASLHTPKH